MLNDKSRHVFGTAIGNARILGMDDRTEREFTRQAGGSVQTLFVPLKGIVEAVVNFVESVFEFLQTPF